MARAISHVGAARHPQLSTNPGLSLRSSCWHCGSSAVGYDQVQLLLPFVRTVEEFVFCRQMVERAGLTENPHFQLWIMAEVPSVLMLLPEYVAAGVQGIAIGSNDLTQLMLGVDREHSDMAIAFAPHHPAMLRTYRQLIMGAQQAGIPCTLCGYVATQYPEMIEVLVHWGITAISVSPHEVEQVQNAIARARSTPLPGLPLASPSHSFPPDRSAP
ncbi:MAG: hypothetical protein HC781_04615 [Leptolyngbyaceae cyanobacterium CSU_1_4]|nr:hypothetical protein [Leptolyngbyaceae cyanobacterium CSU_1_4]